MVVKYCVDNDVCVTDFSDVTYEYLKRAVVFTPLTDDIKVLVINDLSQLDARSILDKLFNYGKVDLTMYKNQSSYWDED